MIQTFSSTIRRREMDAVLTCMVDEKIGPGELNARLIQNIKENFQCAGSVALRSPSIALHYALKAMNVSKDDAVMISALAPAWQIHALEDFGYTALVLDVQEETGLVNSDIVSEGMKNGGRVLLLHETMGILPDMDNLLALNIPIIEDISQSVGAVYRPDNVSSVGEDLDASAQVPASDSAENLKKAGSFGVFTIMGMEENDIVTAGGGAVLIAPKRRDWTVLKEYADAIPRTDLLPDINSALGFVQLKEFRRNEEVRKEIFAMYQRSLMAGKNKTFIRSSDDGSAAWGFPVVLSGNCMDARKYAERKEIEVKSAFEDSVIALRPEDFGMTCKKAKSLFMRCVLFPMYPRLSKNQILKISKVLGTLP